MTSLTRFIHNGAGPTDVRRIDAGIGIVTTGLDWLRTTGVTIVGI